MHLYCNSQLRLGFYFNGFPHRFLFVYTAVEKYGPILVSSIKSIVHNKQDIASLGIFQESNNQEKFQRGIAVHHCDLAKDAYKGDRNRLVLSFCMLPVRKRESLLNRECDIFINKSQQQDMLRWCDSFQVRYGFVEDASVRQKSYLPVAQGVITQ